ncbi:hypothetical protein C482_19244 [Natrialba chahannaoensis JCM 10990]|uniref:Uncharacterized protein n=2 Tax=Natrialba chahannaoensis TaxID=68911 RepID=M0A4B6_9EURY|nr:hypothetical protein C482_19244 [Natrialba chahannaoensis JCM 10990]
MPSNQNTSRDDNSGILTDEGFDLFVILGLSIGIGVFGVWLTSDLTVVLTWFWIGIGLSIVYLLYNISQGVHQLMNKY